MDLTAFVLAGGKSSRMGTDKAFIELDGLTLLDRVLSVARTITPNVHILGPRAKFAAYGSTIEDVFPERGPLGGIHAALTATATDLNLILAVDAPFVRPDFLRYMITEAERCQALVTVPRIASPHASPGKPMHTSLAPDTRPSASRRRSEFHPLCAIYRRAFRERAETALRAGHNKIAPLFLPAETRIITETELAQLAFPVSMFENINTPEELERAALHQE